jgi:hypothetical protein
MQILGETKKQKNIVFGYYLSVSIIAIKIKNLISHLAKLSKFENKNRPSLGYDTLCSSVCLFLILFLLELLLERHLVFLSAVQSLRFSSKTGKLCSQLIIERKRSFVCNLPVRPACIGLVLNNYIGLLWIKLVTTGGLAVMFFRLFYCSDQLCLQLE